MRRSRGLACIGLGFCLSVVGCEGDEDDSPDSGPADSGRTDTGVRPDTGVDTGVEDTGVEDTGVEDTGVVDTGADGGIALVPSIISISATGHDRLLGATHDSTGRIYVTGIVSDSTTAADFEMVVGRLTSDGEPDPTFGTNGFTRVNVVPAGTGEVARGVVVQGDGRIVISGTVEDPTAADPRDRNIALVRFDEDGTIDSTFGTDGIQILDISTGTVAGNGFAADTTWGLSAFPDDDLLVAGALRAEGRTDLDFAAVRLDPDGAYDDEFGTDGVFSLDIGMNGASPRTATILSDGTMVIAGYMNAAGVVSPVLYKLTAEGELDDTFGVNGVYTEVILATVTEAYAAALQGTSFVTAGYGRELPDDPLDWISLRIDADGTRDTTFGTGNGYAAVDLAGFNDNARNLVVLPDERVLLVGGGRPTMDNVDAMIAVLTVDGELDTTFGNGGIMSFDLAGATDFFWGASLAPDASHVMIVGTRQVAADTGANDESAVLVLPLE